MAQIRSSPQSIYEPRPDSEMSAPKVTLPHTLNSLLFPRPCFGLRRKTTMEDYRSAMAAETTSPRAARSVLSPSLMYPSSPMGRYGISSSPIRTSPGAPGGSPLSPASRTLLSLSSVVAPLERAFAPPPPPSLDTTRSVRLTMRPSERPPPVPFQRRGPRLPRASSSRTVYQRKRFLVFIKILLKCLKRSNDARLFYQAKTIIAECTQRNRQKDPKYTPLPEAVEWHLRPVVGETQWKRANDCLNLYLEKRRQLHRTGHSAAPAPRTEPALPVDPLEVFPDMCHQQHEELNGKPVSI